jgi:hypothetical protein
MINLINVQYNHGWNVMAKSLWTRNVHLKNEKLEWETGPVGGMSNRVCVEGVNVKGKIR